VNKLKPGCCLTFHRGGLALHQYWDIPSLEVPQDEKTCQEILAGLINDAVTMQLVSDVPLGAFLSGGIDSSTVVALMSQASGAPIQTFSIGFEEKSYNELPYARDVANAFDTVHREQIMVPEIASLAEHLIGHLDEPFGDFSIFPTYLVSQLASKSVKVVLSGDGGDEIFGGYETYVAQQLDGYYRRLPSVLRKKALPALMNLIPPQPVKKGLINKTKRFLEGSVLPRSLMHTRWMMFMSREDMNSLYRREWRNAADGHSATSLFEDYFYQARHFDPLAQQQYVDVKTYLADDILTKVDRMSMALSIEARVPLLDHRIVEFALNLPQSMKIHRGKTKIVLRDIMKDRLPKSVLNKPKQGFSIPMKNWLRGPLKPLVTDLLSESCIRQRGYFNPQTISRWLQEHLDGRANHSHRLWSLMAFELWQEKILPVQS
jgi:asparagine synthase (glutamine-hydrolysing)